MAHHNKLEPEILHNPAELAKKLFTRLSAAGINDVPPIELLTTVFDTLFYLSLKTEEGHHVRCSIVYLPPWTHRPVRPKRRTVDERSSWANRFNKPLPFSIGTLRKLAPAVDPSKCSLGLYLGARGKLEVWGIVDQFPLHMARSMAWESERAAGSPGLFYAVISASGELTVYVGDQVVAVLRQDRLITRLPDALWHGPLYAKLTPYVRKYQNAVKSAAGTALYKSYGQWFDGTDEEETRGDLDWSEPLRDTWLGTLCRILLEIQRYRHGGAVLISHSHRPSGVNIKYPFDYSRIDQALMSYAEGFISQESIETQARQGLLDHIGFRGKSTASQVFFMTPDSRENIFMGSVRAGENEALFRSWYYQALRTDSMAALAGAVGLVASLSCVDGLVLMSRGFRVLGFGAVIVATSKVDTVFVANDEMGKTNMTQAHADAYGTRHRSMFNYCASHSGSVGFVVSQDGDIRAITKVGVKLVMWENIRLHAGTAEPNFIPPFGWRKGRTKKTRLPKAGE